MTGAGIRCDAGPYHLRGDRPYRLIGKPRPQTRSWQHRRYSADGTWDAVLTYPLTVADAEGKIDWDVTRGGKWYWFSGYRVPGFCTSGTGGNLLRFFD